MNTDRYEGHIKNIGRWQMFANALPRWAEDADRKLVQDVPLLLEEVKRLRFHLKDVVDELATHLGDYENEMYDWIRKMHELYGSD